MPGQQLTRQFPAEKALLVLRDGELTATDGCNMRDEWTGTFELDGDKFDAKVDAYDMAGSACAFGQLQYPTVLERARTTQLDGDRLRLLDADGELVGEFTRWKPAS